MIDFSPMRDGELTYLEFAARENIGPSELKQLSDESVDLLLGLLDELKDADIVFEPADPDADDPFAVEGEEEIGWNFGHLIASPCTNLSQQSVHESVLLFSESTVTDVFKDF